MRKILIKPRHQERTEGPFTDKFRDYYTSDSALDKKMVGKTTPTAVHNLEIFSRFLFWSRFRDALKAKGKDKGPFKVLFDGYSTPFNAVAVHQFLVQKLELNPSEIQIMAIDLDPKAMQEGLILAKEKGIDFSFEVADARNLPFPNRSFSIVFHDFLLNCAPHSMHIPILLETTRMLDPEIGIGMIGWSSLEGIEKRRKIIPIEKIWANKEELKEAFQISDLNPASERKLNLLLNELGVFLLDRGDGFIVVSPNQDFEFFRDKMNMIGMIQETGMTLMEMDLSIGLDRYKNVCWRHRFITAVNPEIVGLENPEIRGEIHGTG